MSSPSPLLRTISLLLRMPSYGVGCGIKKAAARYPNFREWMVDFQMRNVTESRNAKLHSNTINYAASEASHGAVGAETLPSTEELLQTAAHFFGKVIVYSVAGGIFFVRTLGLSQIIEEGRQFKEYEAFNRREYELSVELYELVENVRAREEDKIKRLELNQQIAGNK